MQTNLYEKILTLVKGFVNTLRKSGLLVSVLYTDISVIYVVLFNINYLHI